MAKFVPQTGDVIWLDFDPQAGHEHGKRRPAVVLSPASYNKSTSLMICCPITSKIKGYPFEVAINGKISGVILADQVKSLDWVARNAELADHADDDVIDEVLAMVAALLNIQS
ncbi:endoribonuclease MazF [uncultured Deefgea sp.]|uniref:endoribonuclease MazF n=1 Tax=uncultured Deefgea sp. TaxID=1304914 RepID=UPI002611B7E3|nr:endoribonuclease MazF [uncultured Deefgea sp.]